MFAPELPTVTSAALVDTQVHVPLGPEAPKVGRPDPLKRAFDLVVGLAMLVAAAPVIAITWCAVRLTSPGPGFYSQVRVGRHGRTYRIYKVRTMRNNCELKSGIKWSSGKSDSRVTPLGRVLRKLHLDELPQLWNVIRGDMSLVGPRPERPEFVVPLTDAIPGYPERHAVRPGLTGLAQIQLPADSSIESVKQKLVLDRCYVDRNTLWLDVRIMAGTAVYLCGVSYATVRRLLALPNPLAESLDAGGRPAAGPPPVLGEVNPVPAAKPTRDQDSLTCGRA